MQIVVALYPIVSGCRVRNNKFQHIAFTKNAALRLPENQLLQVYMVIGRIIFYGGRRALPVPFFFGLRSDDYTGVRGERHGPRDAQ